MHLLLLSLALWLPSSDQAGDQHAFTTEILLAFCSGHLAIRGSVRESNHETPGGSGNICCWHSRFDRCSVFELRHARGLAATNLRRQARPKPRTSARTLILAVLARKLSNYGSHVLARRLRMAASARTVRAGLIALASISIIWGTMVAAGSAVRRPDLIIHHR
jgi:hypothetical protein